LRQTTELLDLIGHTPLVKIRKRVFAKLESVNPSGSIKDRMALYMLEAAEKAGVLTPGCEIVEATSGNTGIAFAMIATLRGYRFTAILAETMSAERRQMMQVYGAHLVLTPTMEDAVRRVDEYADADRVWLPRQFDNQLNIDCHRDTTGREILQQLDDIGAVVAGVGTGGTLMGVAEALRSRVPDLQVVAVEPAESPVLSGGQPGHHQIQGIGSGFIPKLVDPSRIDEIVRIRSADAIQMARRLAQEQGLLVGISSGANVLAARRIAERMPNSNVVTVLPDSGNRYLSLGLGQPQQAD
jgi:cysteine synthase A